MSSKASLVYRASSRTTRTVIQRSLVSKNQNKHKQTKRVALFMVSLHSNRAVTETREKAFILVQNSRI